MKTMKTKFNEEKFLKTLFKEAAEEPSIDFVRLLMGKVEQENWQKQFLKNPVIGWKGWIVFAFCFLAILFFSVNAQPDESIKGIYDQLLLNKYGLKDLKILQSSSLIYIGIVASAILILIDFFVNRNQNVIEK